MNCGLILVLILFALGKPAVDEIVAEFLQMVSTLLNSDMAVVLSISLCSLI